MSASAPRSIPLNTMASLEPHNVRAEVVTHRGRRAVRLVPQITDTTAQTIALVKGLTFGEGTIDLDVAGAPLPDANEGARGFIGIAFHVQDVARFKCFYLRPTNGRADDQLRRNHATQYISEPEHPWHRLRKEEPGQYESYVDLVPGEWTKLRVVVRGTRAELFVGDAPQPVLVVTDLKSGAITSGGIALWIGDGTDGHFANLRIR